MPSRYANGILVAMGADEAADLIAAFPDEIAAARASMIVTDLQFALACVASGLMTAQEAEDWVGAGVLPSAVTSAISAITDPQTLAAVRIRIRGARVIERSNLVIDLLQQHLGLSAAQVDAVFVAAAAL